MSALDSGMIAGSQPDRPRRNLIGAAASSLALAGTSALLPAAPALAQQARRGGARSAGTLTVGFRANPSSLDPHTGSGGSDHTILYPMFDTLVWADDDFRPQPGLAQSWELRDERELILKLRRGVKFHDGTAFDAESVKWNLERVRDPKTRSTAAGSVSSIESIRVLDPHTVLIRTDAPSAPLLLNLADRAGMMLSPAAAAKFGDDIRRNPVGTGPYRFDSWRQDNFVRLVAHDGYWDPKNAARVGAIAFQLFATEAPMLAALQTGEVDIAMLAETSVPIMRNVQRVQLVERPGARVLGIRGNNAVAPLADRNVRLAIAHALDRDQLFNTLFKDAGTRGDGIVSPAHAWAYDPKFRGPTRDLAKARAFLKQSSMPDGFELKIASPNSVALAQSVAQIVQAQLKEIGATVSINVMELARMVPALKSGAMHAQASFFSIRPDPDGYVYDQYHSTGGFNYGNAPQPLIDPLLKRARETYDIAERRKLYLQAQEAVINLEATGFVWGYASSVWAVSRRTRGFSPGPEGKGRFHRVEIV